MANSFFTTPSGVKQTAFSDLTGSPTASQGVASLINASAVNLTAQVASIGSTTLYAVPSSGAGIYCVSYFAINNSAGKGTDGLNLMKGRNNGSPTLPFKS